MLAQKISSLVINSRPYVFISHKIALFNKPGVMALVLLLLSLLFSLFIVYIIFPIIEKITHLSKTKLDDIIFNAIRRPLFYFIMFILLYVVVEPISAPPFIYKIIDFLVIISLAIIVIKILDSIINSWVHNLTKKTKTYLDDSLLPLAHKTTKILVFFIALIIFLSDIGVEISPLVASLGVAGLAVSLALQDTLKNVFGGIMLLMDKTFKIGDKIKIGNIEGIIKDIGLRSTKISTYDNELIIIPNSILANKEVLNFGQPDETIRVVIPFLVSYGIDIDKVKLIVKDAINNANIDGLVKPRTTVEFVEMADFGLKFKAKFWVDSYKKAYDAKLKATEAIYRSLQKHNISIPYPSYQIFLNKD